MIKLSIFIWAVFQSLFFLAQDTLYINRGVYTINPETIHKIAINDDEIFTRENAVVDVNLNESFSIYLINNDTVQHTLNSSILSSPVTINPSQGVLINSGALSFGTYLIYHEDSSGDLLGSGVIVRAGINGQKYSWDLWDMSTTLAEEVYNGDQTDIPSVYRPTFFSINGGVDPMDMMAGAMIMGNVGDSIYISVVNTGNMTHTLHFHGYHIEILQSDKKPISVGWRKDSFPVFVKDAMTLLLVPHQPGEFPVHNHNLVATLFNNGYPLGMATMLMIEE
jgi:hypothetical protein